VQKSLDVDWRELMAVPKIVRSMAKHAKQGAGARSENS
jgi:hypothetical protein